MIRIVVLGSGGAVPSPERNLTGIAVRWMGNVYLFDCAEGTQRQMMRYGISYGKVAAIFVSHLHGDHIYGIPGLCRTLIMAGRQQKLLIFGPPGTEHRMRGLAGTEPILEVKDIDAGWRYDLGEAEIYAFGTIHTTKSLGYVFQEKEKRRFDKEKCTELGIKGKAFRILEEKGEIEIKGRKITLEEVTYIKPGKKIVYTGDTAYSEEVIKHAKGADILFHDATFMEEHRAQADADKHSTILDAARAAKESGAKKLIAFHLSNRYKDWKAVLAEGKQIFENIEIAYDGMDFTL